MKSILNLLLLLILLPVVVIREVYNILVPSGDIDIKSVLTETRNTVADIKDAVTDTPQEETPKEQ